MAITVSVLYVTRVYYPIVFCYRFYDWDFATVVFSFECIVCMCVLVCVNTMAFDLIV